MLSYAELLGQVRDLKPEERLALFEATAQMIQEDLNAQTPETTTQSHQNLPTTYKPFVREDLIKLDREALIAKGVELRGTPVEEVLGIAKVTQGQTLPTDDENKEDYTDYLIKKYS